MKVDVAAPGVIIRASIPGNEYLELSGTSMAAPFVTNVAARLKDANPSLSPSGIKKLLCETVDVKPWLQGKVRTSGIVNPHRAIKAAELSVKVGLDAAIAQSKSMVLDSLDVAMPSISPEMEKELLVAPMPTLF